MKYARVLRRCVYAVCALFLINNCVYGGQLKAKARMIDTEGKSVGEVLFMDNDDGSVGIELDLSSFPPGAHAFHIHEKPVCEAPDFKSAGGHFNPYNKKHGFLNIKGHHAGDLPNIIVDKKGNCKMSFITNQISLSKTGANSILKAPGTSLVIHEMPDDYFTDPAGKGCNRIACGLIKETIKDKPRK
ncbi:superoxide dismutase family protein [bacterium]|nr:superoxide dismutase family protein [bacterium]